jgi:hypothetical protein
MIAKAWWFSIMIGIVLIGLAVWWLQRTVPINVVAISVSAEAPHVLPVYAQFDVTQTLNISQSTQITQIELPVTMSAQPTGELLVDLLQDGQVLQHWRIKLTDYISQANQTITLTLPLQPTRLLENRLEIHVAAPQLDAHFPEQAPQVLVEDADQGYPDGNYRIAQNEKKGDISLRISGQSSQWELYQQHWWQRPLATSQQLGQVVLGCVWLLCFPWLWTKQPTQ